jgi:hypothetical protein
MGHVAAVFLLLQQLQVAPFPAEAGQAVVVRASDAAGPRPGLAVDVELPDGTRRQVGSTDGHGEIGFVPEVPGPYCYRAELDGVRLVAPHMVVALRRRWLLALACVPLGLVLLWRTLTRPRTRTGAAAAEPTSGPSRPSP